MTKIKLQEALPDLDRLRPELQRLQDELVESYDSATEALDHLQGVEPDTDEHLALFEEGAEEARKERKRLEETRTSLTKPLNAFLRTFNGAFKPTDKALDDMQRLCVRKLDQGRRDREAAREEALQAIEEAGGHVADTIVLPTQAKPVQMPKGTGREVVQVEILDQAEVPREYCVPCPKLLRAAATLARKQGKDLQVAGVRFTVKAAGT